MPSSLFTDAAIVADVPARDRIAPHTLAQAMPHGWCWAIPHRDEVHRGYVFSSAHVSRDAAEAELRAIEPAARDVWSLRFRAGRHAHFWRGNVVALGNAYAFVEPLESTALHMLIEQIRIVARAIPARRSDVAAQPVLDAEVGRRWDWLRSFLALPSRFGQGAHENEFWRACARDTDLAGAEPLVELYREAAPSTCKEKTGKWSDVVCYEDREDTPVSSFKKTVEISAVALLQRFEKENKNPSFCRYHTNDGNLKLFKETKKQTQSVCQAT